MNVEQMKTQILSLVDTFQNKESELTDLDRSIASFENSETHNIVHIQSDCIIATDGAYSAIRDKMQKLDRFNYHQYYIYR